MYLEADDQLGWHFVMDPQSRSIPQFHMGMETKLWSSAPWKP
jgi:hypothetical protein